MKFLLYEILQQGPPLETMQGPPLEDRRAAKCHVGCKVPHSAKCHIVGYAFIERKYESLKARERDFAEFVLQYFQKIMTYHSSALCISMYVLSYKKKTSLLTEFYTHYSLL